MIALLAISLLAILAGTLLLAKNKKDQLGKFFYCVSWFFIIAGFLLFIGSVAGEVCYITHGGKIGYAGFHHHLMKACQQGTPSGTCYFHGQRTCINKDKYIQEGCYEKHHKCMQHCRCIHSEKCIHKDCVMKICPRPLPDTSKRLCPKEMSGDIPAQSR